MNVLGWMGRGLLLAITTAVIGAWISVVTLNMTLLNRGVVLGWLSTSGAYNHLADSIVNLQAPENTSDTLNADALKEAMGNTLTPSFVRQTSEKVVNAVYDWVEDKTSTISFSVSLADKRDDLQQQLAAALKPELAKLPVCSSSFGSVSSQGTQCLPKGASAEATANAQAQQAVESSDFLEQPITAESLGGPLASQSTAAMAWLPALVQNFSWLSFVLPIIAAVCVAGYVLLSADKRRGLRTIAGHIFFGTTFATVAGVVIWGFGGSIHFADALGNARQGALVTDVVEPIIHQAAPAIGMWLTIVAGSLWLVAGATWITLLVVHGHKKDDTALHEPLKAQPHHAEDHPQKASEPATPELENPAPNPPKPKPPTPTVGRM